MTIQATVAAQTEKMMVPKKKPTPFDKPTSKFVSDIQIYNYLINEKKSKAKKSGGRKNKKTRCIYSKI